MTKKYLLGSMAVWLVAGCGSSSTTDAPVDASVDPDASGSETLGDDAVVTPTDGAPSDSGACASDGDCASLLASVTPTPAGCAEAYCNKATGTCGLRAADKDGDGYRTAQCDVPGFSAFEKGNDCDDVDKAFFPGKSRDCSANPDGTKITWPTGAPVGLCKFGQEACGADGKTGACTGAVAPAAKPNCMSTDDSTCVGKTDASLCGCKVHDTRSCYDGPAGTMGKGPCVGGTQTCEQDPADSTKSSWGSCQGQVVPKAKDGCTPTNDDNCSGTFHDGCSCWGDVTNDSLACAGQCTNGTHTCNTATGAWTGCSGVANRISCDTTGVIDGATRTCSGAGTKCATDTTCTGTGPSACTPAGACAGYACPGSATCNVTTAKSSCNVAGDGVCNWGTKCPTTSCISGLTNKTCGACNVVACGTACKSHCPSAAWSDYGSYCELVSSSNGSFGITSPLGWMTPTVAVTKPAGWSDAGSYVRVVGSQATNDKCGNNGSINPMELYCNRIFQTGYSEADFAAGAARNVTCAGGGTVEAYHSNNGAWCCGGGCARNYTLEVHARVSPCGG